MEILKMLRMKKGVSQTDVAKYLGITRQGYNHYENGKREPDNDTLVKISKFFNVSVDYLLGKESANISAFNKQSGDIVDESEFVNKSLKELMEDQDGILFFEGQPLDTETKKLLIDSLKNTYRMTKAMAERDKKSSDNNIAE